MKLKITFGLLLGLSFALQAWAQTTPLISDIEPALAPLYGGPFTLTVNGQNFDSTSQIAIGNSTLATTFVSNTQLTGLVTTAALTTSGTVQVTVTTGGVSSNAVPLKVVERGDLNGNHDVNISDALVCALTVGTFYQPPLSSTVGDVNLNGTVNIGDCLVTALFSGGVLPNLAVPAITSVSPVSVNAGSQLTITGTGFSPVAAQNRVLFTTEADTVVRVTPSVSSLTNMTVTVPANAVSGPIQTYRLDVPLGGTAFPLNVNGTTPSLTLTQVNPFYKVAPGSVVTLNGMGFDATPASNTIFFQTNSGPTGVTAITASTTSLTVMVPQTAICGAIRAMANGQTSNSRALMVSGTTCAPQIADLSRGDAGDTVVIEGMGWSALTPGANIVTFTTSSGTGAATVLSAGRTQLQVRIPDNAIDGNVVVTAGGQMTNAVAHHSIGPRLISIAPNSTGVGTSVTATLTGTNFIPGATTVSIGGTGVTGGTVNVTTSTSLTVALTAGQDAIPADHTVTVSTAQGTSNALTFTVLPPPPTLISIDTPDAGPGWSVRVTLTGTNFVNGAAVGVTGGGITVSSVAVTNSTSLTAILTIAANAAVGSRNITVATSGGTSASLPFNVAPVTATSIALLDPVSGTPTLELAVNEGNSVRIPVRVIDSAATTRNNVIVNFSVLDPSIASVDAQGNILGKKFGFVTMTSSLNTAAQTTTVNVVQVGAGASQGSVNGIVQDLSRNIYMTAGLNDTILVAPALGQMATVYAGSSGVAGLTNDVRLLSRFNNPSFLALNQADASLYVSDSANHAVRTVHPGSAGTVETLAGNGTAGSTDGPLANAQFNNPQGIALDSTGHVWVADSGNNTIRRITLATGAVETIAGQAGAAGSADGNGSAARFNAPAGIAVVPETLPQQLSRIYNGGAPPRVSVIVADTGNGLLRKVRDTGVVETIGIVTPADALPEGPFPVARDGSPISIGQPGGVAVDAFGNIYVVEGTTGQVKTILSSGTVVSAAQSNTFQSPKGLVTTESGRVVVADSARGIQEIRYAPPQISSTTPGTVSAAGGETVTITGNNFPPDTIVIAGGIVVSNLNVIDSQTISFTTPPVPSGRTTLTVQTRAGVAQTQYLARPVALSALPPGSITTIAGGSTFVGDGGPAISAAQPGASVLALDNSGNTFVLDKNSYSVRRIDARTGIVTTVAGTGVYGNCNYGVPAVACPLNNPLGIAIDAAGNLFISEYYSIEKVDAATGLISIAYYGIGNVGLAFDRKGNLIASGDSLVKRIDAQTGAVTTIAGTGTPGFSGDGGPAASAQLNMDSFYVPYNAPATPAIDSGGNIYIADNGNYRIRRIDAVTGIITTVAGNGQVGVAGDGGPATQAMIGPSMALSFDPSGNLLFVDSYFGVIRRVNAATGIISTIAGRYGHPGLPTSGVPATASSFVLLFGLAADGAGNILLTDHLNRQTLDANGHVIEPDPTTSIVMKIDSKTGILTTISGRPVDPADGGPAWAGLLISPGGVAADVAGNVYIADSGSRRVRKIDTSGVITTLAGGGSADVTDGAIATNVKLKPYAVAVDPQGDVLIADDRYLRKVHGTTITTIGGTNIWKADDVGQPATSTYFGLIGAIRTDPAGNIYVSTETSVRRIDAVTHIVSMVAGPGQVGVYPASIVIDSNNNMYIADYANNRVLKVDGATHGITTVAGSGNLSSGYHDYQPATSVWLGYPRGLALDPSETNLFITDFINVRRLDLATGIINTAAGRLNFGSFGNAGDGGPAWTAQLSYPWSIAFDKDGNLLIADITNLRVRAVRGPLTIMPRPPAVSSVNPNKGLQGRSVQITVTGANFIPGFTSVSFGQEGIVGASVNVTSSTSLTLTAMIPTNVWLADYGIRVTTLAGYADASFTVVPPPPTISSLSPNSGTRGQTVQVLVSGTNFVSGHNTVTFSGQGISTDNTQASYVVASPQPTFVATFTIAADAPLGEQTVTVTTSGGSATSTFTVVP